MSTGTTAGPAVDSSVAYRHCGRVEDSLVTCPDARLEAFTLRTSPHHHTRISYIHALQACPVGAVLGRHSAVCVGGDRPTRKTQPLQSCLRALRHYWSRHWRGRADAAKRGRNAMLGPARHWPIKYNTAGASKVPDGQSARPHFHGPRKFGWGNPPTAALTSLLQASTTSSSSSSSSSSPCTTASRASLLPPPNAPVQ